MILTTVIKMSTIYDVNDNEHAEHPLPDGTHEVPSGVHNIETSGTVPCPSTATRPLPGGNDVSD